MNRSLLLLAAFLPCAQAAAAQAPRDTLTGDQVLERSRAAYARLPSYAGETAVLSELVIGDTVMTGAAVADVRFARPGRFRVSGRSIDGTPYLVVGDGARTRLAMVPTDPGARQRLLAVGRMFGMEPARGDTLSADTLSVEMALASVTGIGARAPFYLPALLGLLPGSPLEHRTPAVLAGRETVAGAESHKVVIRGTSATVTYWVDTTTYLLRQFQEEQTGAQLAGDFGEIGRALAGQDTSSNALVAGVSVLTAGAVRAMPRPGGSSYIVRFSTPRVGAAPDPALFALPPRRPDARRPE